MSVGVWASPAASGRRSSTRHRTRAHPGVGFPVHLLIARGRRVVVENLTALKHIDFADPLITVFPMRLTGTDGAPNRAVAIDLAI
jgi:kynurenine formamidase